MIKQNITLGIRGKAAGHILYSDKQSPPNVFFEVILKGHPAERMAIITYLTTKRSYRIPEPETSDMRDDDDIILTRKPTSRLDYFQLALNEMGRHIGIFLAR